MELWKTLLNKSIDNVVIVVYNGSIINKKGIIMTPEDLKKLEEAHKKAMEGIEAFNQAAKDAIKEGKGMLGLK